MLSPINETEHEIDYEPDDYDDVQLRLTVPKNEHDQPYLSISRPGAGDGLSVRITRDQAAKLLGL